MVGDVTQRWSLEAAGHRHVVEVDDAGLRRRVVWRRDGDVVGTTTSSEERVHLLPDDRDAPVGAIGLRFSAFGTARRVTWYAARSRDAALAKALLGTGGVDLVPEPGSRAAAREQWIRDHPRRYTAQRSAVAALGIVGGLLVAWVLSRIPLPDWDLPRVPRPDLPGLPLPDWTLPDWTLPHWTLPVWLRRTAAAAGLVLPVLVAVAVARVEVRRRRRQDQQRQRQAEQQSQNEQPCDHPATAGRTPPDDPA